MPRNTITLNTYPLPILQAPDPWGGNRPSEIVGTGWTQAQAYANVAFNTAQAYISNLSDIAAAAADLPTIAAEIDPVASAITAFAMPTAPARPGGLDITIPDAPTLPTIAAISAIDPGDAPVFDGVLPAVNLDVAAPTALDLTLPAAPDLRDTVLPDAPVIASLAAVAPVDLPDSPAFVAQRPDVNLDIAPPSAFDATLPVPPSINDLTLPDVPEQAIVGSVGALTISDAPAFSATPPTIDLSPTPPSGLSPVLPSAPSINEVVLPPAPTAPVVGSVTMPVIGDVPTLTVAAPTLNFDMTAPAGLNVTLPDVPSINAPVVPSAPSGPVVGSVSGLTVGTAPDFTAAPPELDFDIAAPDSLQVTLPTAPVVRDVTIPDAPLIGDLATVEPLDAGVAPEFTATPPALDLDIARPAALSATVPTAPALDPVVIPGDPTITLPDVPNLRDLVIPTEPDLALPEFTAQLADAPVAPDVSFAWVETPYASDLLAQLRAKLQEWVGGASTGLEAVVEEAIWNRMRDREQRSAAQGVSDVVRQFAVRGFSRPPGAVAVALQRAMQVLNDNTVTASREIAVQQAQLEQTNRQFAFNTALSVESTLIGYTSQIAGRALDAAKFAAQIGIEIFQAEVSGYQAEIQAFAARAEVFRAVLQAELSKLDIFRAQIEAQKLIGDINQQQVALYTARVGAAEALIDLFRSRIQAAQANAEVQRTRIQAYATEVQAYGEQVRAKAAEYDAYATQIRAEVSKAETFKVEADAFASRVQGFTAVLNARTAEKQSETDIKQRLPVEIFKARTEGFRNMLQGLQTQAETDRTRVQAYSAEVSAQGELTRARALDVDVFRARIDAEKSKAETFRLQAEAYGRQVDGYRALTDAMVAQKNVEIKLATEVPIELNKADIAIYDASLRGLQAQTETDRTRVQAYSAQVSAIGELTRARGVDTDIYRAAVDAEKAKADIYRIRVDAYGREVDAYKAVADALIAVKTLEIKVATEVPIEISKADIAVYEATIRGLQIKTETDRTLVQAYGAQIQALGELTRARAVDTDIYKATVEAERAKADTYRIEVDAYGKQVDAYKALTDAAIAQKNIEVKLATEVPIEVSKARVAVYDAVVRATQTLSDVQRMRIQGYQAEVDAYGKAIQAKGLENDIYRTRIEAEKSKTDIYRIDTEAYKAQVDAFDALVRALVAAKNSEIDVTQKVPLERLRAEIEAFRASLQGVETTVRADGLQIDRYRAQLDGVGRQIEAQRNEVEVYKATLDGEKIKTDVYRAQADAFQATVGAFRAKVDALVAVSNQQIEVGAKLPVELYRAQALGYESVVRAESARLKALTDTYETDGRVFEAQTRAESARVGAEADVFKADTDRVSKIGELRLRAAEVNLQRAQQQVALLIEAVKAGAQMSAQLASSALSVINLSGGLSASESYSTSTSTSNTTSTSDSRSDSYSESKIQPDWEG
jgi:hypothetical protein